MDLLEKFLNNRITEQMPNRLFDELNKQIKNEEYNEDSRLYESPADIGTIYPYGRVWENGKVGFFLPFEQIAFDLNFLRQFQKDGNGLRFVQFVDKGDYSNMLHIQRKIIVSGFGEYVLTNWGNDLEKLCNTYIFNKLIIRVEQWKNENYPTDIQTQLMQQLLDELKTTEQKQRDEATISEFFSKADNKSLIRCMETFFERIDNITTQLKKQLPKTEQPNPNDNTNKPQRKIDSERLKDYFKPEFRGMGRNLNHFESFVSDLEKDRIPKTFAQVALMCLKGNQMNNRKPNTFSEWYSIFCECVQCEKKTYKPKDLKPIPENIVKLFDYLGYK